MHVYGGKEMANAFRTVRGNTIQIAEDIPEEQYGFRAADGVMSIGELLRHIVYATMIHYDFHRDKRITTLQGYSFPEMIGRMKTEEQKTKSKAEIIAALKQSGEEFAKYLESLSSDFLNETFTDTTGQNPRTRMEHLLGAKEHEMHHRGQLMLIQRMIGVVPHLTRQRMARAAARPA
jgi:uncharacterized damage-inducible protein DinB